MSKKLAAGADCIVLDVKVGRGAFMQTLDDARRLAETMVRIGEHAGRRVAAVLSSMEQPLGRAIGNALEVKEAIATLRGDGEPDLADLCVALSAQLLILTGRAPALVDAERQLRETLHNGNAWHKFVAFVRNQGGDQAAIEDPNRLAAAPHIERLLSPASGYIAAIDALELGLIVGELGGGRQRKGDVIDPAVGIVLKRKVGDSVARGDALAELHVRDLQDIERICLRSREAFRIAQAPVERPPLIYEIIR
jgi:pyrimidine-nucleoside phosphorylase